MKYYLSIDLGASSGRHILGYKENGEIVLKELYRFKNGVTEKDGRLYAYEIKSNPLTKAKIPQAFLNAYPSSEVAVISPENYEDFIL